MNFFRSLGTIVLTIAMALIVSNCQWGPKEQEVIMPGFHNSDKIEDAGLFFDLHRVKALEILPTDSYIYLKVSEGERKFWIATRKGNYQPDSIYYYREALLKKDFESKQLDRVYDSIYLVTKLVSELHHLDQQHQ